MKHISKDMLFVGMLFAVVMMTAQPGHAQGSISPRSELQAQLNEARQQVSEIRVQMAAVDEQIADEKTTVDELAAVLKGGGDPQKVAFLLAQSEERANGFEKTITEISDSVAAVRKALQTIAAKAEATRMKKIFLVAQRMLDEVENGLVPSLEESKKELQELRDSIEAVRGQLGSIT